jgi:hypothetical protein
MKLVLTTAAIASIGLSLGGCVVSQIHLGDDFGVAAHQDAVAQIADPDPRRPTAPPVTDGARLGLAMTRYQADKPADSTIHASGIGAMGAAVSAGP